LLKISYLHTVFICL